MVLIHRAFGMPLNGEHKVVGGSSFEGLDDAIVGAAGDDAESIAGAVRGLMVAGIDGGMQGCAGLGEAERACKMAAS